MAKSSKKPIPATPATTPPASNTPPPFVPAEKMHDVLPGELNWAPGIKLEGKSVPVPDSYFSKSAQTSNLKRYTEQIEAVARKMRDIGEYLEYVDQAPAKSESDVYDSPPQAAPQTILKPVSPPRKGGRPNKSASIVAAAKQMIKTGEVVPTPKGLTGFAKRLAGEVGYKHLADELREDWNNALKSRKLK